MKKTPAVKTDDTIISYAISSHTWITVDDNRLTVFSRRSAGRRKENVITYASKSDAIRYACRGQRWWEQTKNPNLNGLMRFLYT